MESVRLEGKTVVITGANRGIGKSTAIGIAQRGARVILACRSGTKAEEARREIVAQTGNANVEFHKVDLASLQSVRDFAQKFNEEEDRLDILICNAGQITQNRTVTEDGHETMFAVNHLAHFLLTNLLLDKLKACAPSRVVVVSSTLHEDNPVNFDDLQSKRFNNFKTYGHSKSCNILFAVHLAKVLKGSGVTVYSLHPGLVTTDFTRDLTFKKYCCDCCVFRILSWLYCLPIYNLEEGAKTTLYCSLEPSIANDSGKYYKDSKEAVAEPHALNEETAKRLWNVSAELCGLK